MNLSEFKHWFEGFTDSMDGPPSAEQWEKIKAKIAKIDGKVTTPVVYREYVERVRPFWPPGVYYGTTHPTLTAGELPRNGGMSVDMRALGKAEFSAMTT